MPPVSRAKITPMIGTDAMSSPVIELDRCRSASDSSAHGTIISTQAKATSQRQYRHSPANWRRRSASGSSSAAATVTRVNTSTGTETPPSATLMNR